MRNPGTVALATVLVTAAVACDASPPVEGPPPRPALVIEPRSVDATVAKVHTFRPVRSGLGGGVAWRVREAGGGTVDEGGRYVAPSTPGIYHVEVRSLEDPARVDLAAVVVRGPEVADHGGLHADGTVLRNGRGEEVRIRGVNHSGTEYLCVFGGGIIEGPHDAEALRAIRGWKANAVRIGLNQDCWLDRPGVQPGAGGLAYQQAIAGYVTRAVAEGLVPILELHWSAPAGLRAVGQQPMPDRDHTPRFWREVAAAFAGNDAVVLELFNEPFPDGNSDSREAWRCWRDGGRCQGIWYEVAGMQELVDAVRGTGARNLVLVGGVRYANALTGWRAHRPDDPLGNLAAAWHVYSFNACTSDACFDATVGAVLQEAPVVATEVGQDDCRGDFLQGVMRWLDARGGSYAPWVWNTWGHCLSLISDYGGTPRGPYGEAYRAHLAAVGR